MAYDIFGEVTPEHGRHIADGACSGFLVTLIVNGDDGTAVGLLGGEHYRKRLTYACLLQTCTYRLGQTTMIGIPQVGKAYLRDIALGTSTHAAHDGYAPAHGLDYQGTLRSDGVDGINNNIKLTIKRSVKKRGYLLFL